jgi:hypothetical protein
MRTQAVEDAMQEPPYGTAAQPDISATVLPSWKASFLLPPLDPLFTD